MKEGRRGVGRQRAQERERDQDQMFKALVYILQLTTTG